MHSGKILVAEHDGVYVIKLVGDVRLTLCISFDEFIQSMFARKDFYSIIFDLSQVEAVDSTTLGLMAKISILSDRSKHIRPVIFSPNASIKRLLESMGFDEIFNVLTCLPSKSGECIELEENVSDESKIKEKVLEAHNTLMGMNKKNEETFQDLVKILEEG